MPETVAGRLGGAAKNRGAARLAPGAQAGLHLGEEVLDSCSYLPLFMASAVPTNDQ